ncbi:MAG: hypothetical protein WC360_08890, partial [Opitutales bacterium]
SELFWYANERPVENRILSGALLEAATGFIPRGRFPAAFLFLDISPEALDVNVHPTKREIRLRDETSVRNFVSAAVLNRMEELAREGSQKLSARTTLPDPAALRPAVLPAPQTRPEANAGKALVPVQPAAGPSPRPSVPAPYQAAAKPAAPPPAAPPARDRRIAGDALPSRWRYLGTAHGNFVLFETPDGLLCLNRTAAQSRVFYEDYLQSLREGHLLTQQLLFTRLFELPPLLADTLERHIDFFRANGFGLESFGGDSFRISSLPAWFEGEGCEDFIKEAVERIAENGMRPDRDAELARDTLARLASAHAARASAPADEMEVLALARRLMSCKNPLADPKGRPTYFELSRGELEKR